MFWQPAWIVETKMTSLISFAWSTVQKPPKKSGKAANHYSSECILSNCHIYSYSASMVIPSMDGIKAFIVHFSSRTDPCLLAWRHVMACSRAACGPQRLVDWQVIVWLKTRHMFWSEAWRSPCKTVLCVCTCCVISTNITNTKSCKVLRGGGGSRLHQQHSTGPMRPAQ